MANTLRECIVEAQRRGGLGDVSAVRFEYPDGTVLDMHNSRDVRLDEPFAYGAPRPVAKPIATAKAGM